MKRVPRKLQFTEDGKKFCVNFYKDVCVSNVNPQPLDNFWNRDKHPTSYCIACCRKARGLIKPYVSYKQHRKNVGNWQDHRRRLIRQSKIKKNYGVSIEIYDRMLIEQSGHCAICARPEGPTRKESLTVDHDHATGKIRGLLCHRCNLGLGHFDDLVLAQSLTDYVYRHTKVYRLNQERTA